MDLGDPPKLKAEVASFLQGSSEMFGEEDPPLEPPVSQPADWVRWRAEECNLPHMVEGINSCVGGRYENTGKGGQGLISISLVQTQAGPHGGPIPHPTISTLPMSMKVYASRSIYFCQPGYKGDSPRKNSSLCMGVAILHAE